LYLVRNGALTEIKADKQPVGRYFDRKPFSAHSIDLEENDLLYIFSDGYADQFGGPAQKKFKTARLKETLLAIGGKTMGEQKEFLDTAIVQWMGDLEQVDDICLMGIRIAG
jgi:serine phosphatase RsbU (regulator of sigma subunit)